MVCKSMDLESNKFLKQYKLKYNKVASAMLTNLKLLEEISKQKGILLFQPVCRLKKILKSYKNF